MAKTEHGRFWEKVVNGPNGCWNFTIGLKETGYAHFRVGGRKGRDVPAHRYAWKSLGMELPDYVPGGLQLDHLCRNRICVNPAHLELVTQKANLLRGNTVARKHSEKTSCDAGHEFTPENTWVYVDKKMLRHRRCRTCKRKLDAAYHLRKKK